MKVLVTGGAGFIGSHIVEHFQGQAEIRVLDSLRSGFRKNLGGSQCEFIRGSVLDRAAVRHSMQGVDYVFHLAAMVSVPESVREPEECARINADGTLVVLEEAARVRVKKLVFSSSAAIYGDSPEIPKHEAMSPNPKSPYASTKLEAEKHCARFVNEGRLQTVCLRYFNVFGPRQSRKSLYAAAVPRFIQRAMKNDPITIFGDGDQTRDFVYVKDVIAANVFFGLKCPATGIFNVACGRGTTIGDLARTIRRLMNSTSEIRHAAPRPGDVKHSVAAVDKLRATGFVSTFDLRNGLRATIQFFNQKATQEALR